MSLPETKVQGEAEYVRIGSEGMCRNSEEEARHVVDLVMDTRKLLVAIASQEAKRNEQRQYIIKGSVLGLFILSLSFVVAQYGLNTIINAVAVVAPLWTAFISRHAAASWAQWNRYYILLANSIMFEHATGVPFLVYWLGKGAAFSMLYKDPSVAQFVTDSLLCPLFCKAEDTARSYVHKRILN